MIETVHFLINLLITQLIVLDVLFIDNKASYCLTICTICALECVYLTQNCNQQDDCMSLSLCPHLSSVSHRSALLLSAHQMTASPLRRSLSPSVLHLKLKLQLPSCHREACGDYLWAGEWREIV